MNHNKNISLYLCNFENTKQMNNDICKRQFPSNQLHISYDFRPSVNICNQICNHKQNKTQLVNVNKSTKLETTFNPGKGSYLGYSQIIDLETKLKYIKKNQYIDLKK
jgi:hypothetical protein